MLAGNEGAGEAERLAAADWLLRALAIARSQRSGAQLTPSQADKVLAAVRTALAALATLPPSSPVPAQGHGDAREHVRSLSPAPVWMWAAWRL
jgi:plasmid stabilization system protein ParE